MTTTHAPATLLLIDGLNIVRRVYEANPAEDSPEKLLGAMRSSLSSFKRAIFEHQPDYALAAFDFGGRPWPPDPRVQITSPSGLVRGESHV